MREIKFRVWDTFDKKYYTLQHQANFGYIMPRDNELKTTTNYELIIEQFTGLQDKNGVDIYENDKVNLDMNNDGIIKATVIYRDDLMMFAFDNPKNVYFMGADIFDTRHIEIIGNIHENKEK